MAACSRVTCLTNKSRTYLYKSTKLYSNTAAVKSTSGQNEIIVPYKIKRGPTDLLKALASTISKDYTAPQYKYEDDPYFIPISNVTKRSFALSKESGKKAARYFLENYSDVFKCNKSDPHIKAFDPPVIYMEDDAVTVETLKDCIKDFDVKNCITVYQNLKKKEICVSQEIKQDLLELLCFYNDIPPPSDDYYEERFYARPNEKQSEKWNAKGMAEMLFQEMEKDGKAYSAIIAGASKFRNAVRAETLYEEMRSKELKGTVEAYNGLLTVVPLLQEGGDTRWEYAMHILSHMSSDGVKPNLHTMNALLATLSRSTRWNKCRAAALKVLAEMKNLKIDLSLGTYHYILMIFYGDEPKIPDVIYEVMNQVRGQEFTIRHPNDVNFFATAMEMCWKAVCDKELAYQLHNLLEYKNNCKLLGNALSEAQYFKCFFRLLSETEDMDKVMEVYEKYVPNTYTPEPSVTFSLLQAIHFSGAYKYLPRLASGMSALLFLF
ncbi:protein PTCD3 homolog, mitochondrial-like, partial [Stegodyphus dumicola]|uniref:protein PTCD3 homolog, mitochondrial-like n=1 Tax=Stegodyphus dumicola TaxID=202533 RepID=UPI0015A77EEC